MRVYFEIVFGYTINESQEEMINNIIENIRQKNQKVYEMIMGGGKTSVIMPYINIYTVKLT